MFSHFILVMAVFSHLIPMMVMSFFIPTDGHVFTFNPNDSSDFTFNPNDGNVLHLILPMVVFLRLVLVIAVLLLSLFFTLFRLFVLFLHLILTAVEKVWAKGKGRETEQFHCSCQADCIIILHATSRVTVT